tara:strand:- start:2851 stop:3501 length:651 start_codon:yes stop_codon:yes gene_type:complete
MPSHEELAYQNVARLAVRHFYDIEETLIMEVVLTGPRIHSDLCAGAVDHPAMQTEECIAKRLGVGTKQVRRHLSRLENDRLVFKTRSCLASRESDDSESRIFWGIDYIVFMDTILFKLDVTRRSMNESRCEKTYSCVACKAVVSSLELTPDMMDIASGSFRCQDEYCNHELVDVDSTEDDDNAHTRTVELLYFTNVLHKAIKHAEGYTLPIFKIPL